MRKTLATAAALVALTVPLLALGDTNTTNNQQYMYNNQQSGTTSLMLMKHLCPSNVTAQQLQQMSFLDEELTCPTVVMQGDTPTPNTLSGGQKNFSFAVNGNQNGMFMQQKVCEDKINYRRQQRRQNRKHDVHGCFALRLLGAEHRAQPHPQA
jgi:hypothetical protein